MGIGSYDVVLDTVSRILIGQKEPQGVVQYTVH